MKTELLDNYIEETANHYAVTSKDLEESLRTFIWHACKDLQYGMVFFPQFPHSYFLITEDYKTILTALGEIGSRYCIRGKKAADCLMRLWMRIGDDENIVESIVKGKYDSEIPKLIY